MNEKLRKLSEEVKAKMSEILAQAEFKSLVEATKAATDSGSFEVVISTADVDRQGESVNQNGWDLSRYMENPVVLWGHDYYSLPIGVCDSISLEEGKLVARGRFAPEEANPFAQQVRRLYDLKIVRATSVGFIALEMVGNEITKAELLEFSFVPVPANPYALSLSQAKKLGIDFAMLSAKGLKIEAKAEGDTCTMDDGSEGVMDAEGVCIAKAAKAIGDDCTMDDGAAGVMEDDGNGGMVCKPKAAPAPEKTAEELAKESDQKLIEDYYAKAEHKEKDVQQIGAILVQLQNVIDTAFVTASKLILDILQTEYGQSSAGKAAISEAVKSDPSIQAIKSVIADVEQKLGISEGEEHRDGDALEQRSEAAGVVDAVKGLKMESLDDFLAVQRLVRSITTVAQCSLEKINKRIAEEKTKRVR